MGKKNNHVIDIEEDKSSSLSFSNEEQNLPSHILPNPHKKKQYKYNYSYNKEENNDY